MARFFGGALRRLRAHCDASNDIWLISRSTKPRGARWWLAICLRMCEVSSLMPPPPAARAPPLRLLQVVILSAAAVFAVAGNQHRLFSSMQKTTAGYSTLSRVAFVSSTVMTATQPFIILLNNAVHFRAFAPHVAALLLPPMRFHTTIVFSGIIMVVMLLGKHGMNMVSGRVPMPGNLLEFLASLVTLSFDGLFVMLCLAAEDKLQDVNLRLSGLGVERPELRALVLETAARQYELTADQVGALGSLGTLGVPLACNSIRHRVKLVTDSFLVYRNLEKLSKQSSGTIAALLFQLAASAQRILAISRAGESLYRESKRTEAVLGAIDSSRWPARERHLVERILRNSRRGVAWSMGGLENAGYRYLLSVIGSTVTYLVVLMQYKDPGED